jgi:hypothetical protein
MTTSVKTNDALRVLNEELVACTRCPRLVEHRQGIARVKRRAYKDWEYWGRPVPGFGDVRARVLVLGLAPGAHGGVAASRGRAAAARGLHHGGGALRASGQQAAARGAGQLL